MGVASGLSPGLMPAGVMAQSNPQKARIDGLKSQYANLCACASCSQPQNADDMLNRIRAEQESHIQGHEQAHQSAAGRFGGGIVIERDGNGVAIAGHVPISMPGLNSLNPEETLKDYKTIRAAALAPSDPSGADMSIAATAQSMMGQAQVLMSQKRNGQRLTGRGGLPAFPGRPASPGQPGQPKNVVQSGSSIGGNSSPGAQPTQDQAPASA